MFTGIIEHVGRVVAARGGSGGAQLTLDLGPCADGVRVGDSIAVDGACLTVTQLEGVRAVFDVGPESLSRTTLGRLRSGDRVHLERALPLGGRLDGHLVQGHVDAVGEVLRVSPRGQAVDLSIVVHDHPLDLVVEKGSIAVAGVSLTVNRVSGSTFEVSLVPLTRQRTTLAGLSPGARVNIELDIIGRYVARLVGLTQGRGVNDRAWLEENGFA